MDAIEPAPAAAWTYLLALYLLTEYGAKQWFETDVVGADGLSARAYALFRAMRLVVNLAGTAFLTALNAKAVALVIAVEVLGLMELPLAALDRMLRERAKARLRWLQALPLAGMALATAGLARGTPLLQNTAALIEAIGRVLPGLAVDPAALGWYVLGYAFAASPANHLVRCLVGKSPDGLLAYSLWRKAHGERTPAGGFAAHEAAATGEDAVDRKDIGSAAAEGASESATLRAGRTIGTLERWIMLSLILVGHYSLIGLVLTAKSIARFKKIEQEPEFAEYYLLGTLYSTLIALLCGMVLIHV